MLHCRHVVRTGCFPGLCWSSSLVSTSNGGGIKACISDVVLVSTFLALADDKVHVVVNVEANDVLIERLSKATRLEVETKKRLCC